MKGKNLPSLQAPKQQLSRVNKHTSKAHNPQKRIRGGCKSPCFLCFSSALYHYKLFTSDPRRSCITQRSLLGCFNSWFRLRSTSLRNRNPVTLATMLAGVDSGDCNDSRIDFGRFAKLLNRQSSRAASDRTKTARGSSKQEGGVPIASPCSIPGRL